jgi:aspartate/methionine/tyrosine aminotransferase
MVHPLYAAMPPTVFDEMSGLARAHGALNLGQGFPDDPGPEALRRAAATFRRTLGGPAVPAAFISDMSGPKKRPRE